jgi:hypothetical protein
MWRRITPPNSTQLPVPLDLVPEDVLRRFRKEMAEYRHQWIREMTAHREALKQSREQGTDYYGDRHQEIFGIRR